MSSRTGTSWASSKENVTESAIPSPFGERTAGWGPSPVSVRSTVTGSGLRHALRPRLRRHGEEVAAVGKRCGRPGEAVRARRMLGRRDREHAGAVLVEHLRRHGCRSAESERDGRAATGPIGCRRDDDGQRHEVREREGRGRSRPAGPDRSRRGSRARRGDRPREAARACGRGAPRPIHERAASLAGRDGPAELVGDRDRPRQRRTTRGPRSGRGRPAPRRRSGSRASAVP